MYHFIIIVVGITRYRGICGLLFLSTTGTTTTSVVVVDQEPIRVAHDKSQYRRDGDNDGTVSQRDKAEMTTQQGNAFSSIQGVQLLLFDCAEEYHRTPHRHPRVLFFAPFCDSISHFLGHVYDVI